MLRKIIRTSSVQGGGGCTPQEEEHSAGGESMAWLGGHVRPCGRSQASRWLRAQVSQETWPCQQEQVGSSVSENSLKRFKPHQMLFRHCVVGEKERTCLESPQASSILYNQTLDVGVSSGQSS